MVVNTFVLSLVGDHLDASSQRRACCETFFGVWIDVVDKMVEAVVERAKAGIRIHDLDLGMLLCRHGVEEQCC